MLVKLIKMGESVTPYKLAESSTASSLFEKANEIFVYGNVTRNKKKVSKNAKLHNGDSIFTFKNWRG